TMPQAVIIFGVQIEDVSEISVEMSPEVKAAVPKVAKLILAELEKV
ncbi:MAG: hypothetical protein JW967_07270, partial [Dehalococcoidales bacterium]|nr:hypothetical protein [Dehalococcoidales bacterium]